MFKRLLLIVFGLLVLAGCAKSPVEELEETRRITAHAYAAGASRLAPDEYRAASEALQKAEQLVEQGAYADAEEAMLQARKLSSRALSLTVHRTELYREEQERQAAEKARQEAAEKAAAERRQTEAGGQQKIAPVAKPEPKPAPAPETELLNHVEVGGEDTLASISAREDVYSEASLWPLIYKANRDQIKDPKQIFPGQILLIPRDKSQEELDAARQEALELNIF